MPENWYIVDKQRKKLLAKIRRLEDELVGERKFRAEFATKLEQMGKNIDEFQSDATVGDHWDKGYKSAYRRINIMYRQCKAQHIDSASESEVEHDG